MIQCTQFHLPHRNCVLTAVFADRLVQQEDEFGSSKGDVKQVLLPLWCVCVLTLLRPFAIELESTNGTHVDGEAIPTSRCYELKRKASDGRFVRGVMTRVWTLSVER